MVTATTGVVETNEQVEDLTPAGAPGDATPEPTAEEDAAYEAAFADAAKAADERKRVANGGDPADAPAVTAPAAESTTEPAPADVVVAPTEPAKVVTKPVAVAPVVPSKDDEELIAALPEGRREAARARFAAAAATEAANRELQHSNRSMAGRVSAFQKQLNEARGQPAAAVDKAATAEETAEWKEIAENYPDLAKAIEAKLKSTRPEADTTTAELVEFVNTERRNRFLTESWNAVESVHPGWRERVNTTEFQEWLKSSPAHEKLAASPDIADAIALFDLHDGYTARNAPKPVVADPAAVAAAAKLAARRGAQIAGAVAAPTTAASPNQAVDATDDDQMFASYAAKANARMAARNR